MAGIRELWWAILPERPCKLAAGQGCFDGRCGFDRRGNRSGQTDVVMDVYGGEWALYNSRSWNSASYNDWWHDQPWRAYPAWVRHNQGCARMWYAADTLRCLT